MADAVIELLLDRQPEPGWDKPGGSMSSGILRCTVESAGSWMSIPREGNQQA